jgi:hypothetical protein
VDAERERMIEREKYLMAQRDGFIKQIQKWKGY